MTSREGETNHTYQEHASGMAFHRLPRSEALVNRTMKLTLDSGSTFDLDFVGPNDLIWQNGGKKYADWYEAIEVAAHTYFIDMTLAEQPRQAHTFVVNTQTRRVVGIRTLIRGGNVEKEPRAVHHFSPGVLGNLAIPPVGRKPGPTRDLIGLRALYTYNANQCFEHIYLNAQRYAWHCLAGPFKGEAQVDFHITYKFDDNQYILAFREFGFAGAAILFHNWNQMRETGKFFAVDENGAGVNTPAGALITKLSMAFYPPEAQPL